LLAVHWVHSSSQSGLPHHAVHGGHDVDRSPIYVGRAYHDGENLPAKVIPSKGCAYVAHNGGEHQKHQYEVLTGHGFSWLPSGSGHIPHNAVQSGTTRSGEPLYIGRAHHNGSLVVGKVHRSHGCLYIPFGGQEVSVRSYEPGLPDHAVQCGQDEDESAIYVGRAFHAGKNLPAKVIPSKGCAYVAYDGREHQKHLYEVLTGYGFSWLPCKGYQIPQNAVQSGATRQGYPIYVGRTQRNGRLFVGACYRPHGGLILGGEIQRSENYEVLIHQ
ncbi:hypothetical protein KR009_005871, partial [Drosophila setifemur]